jgi:cation-transporting ATPase 13A2
MQADVASAGKLTPSAPARPAQAALQRGTVFARMSPDNKKDLVHLMGRGLEALPLCPYLGLHIGFCGDGANDCGALKAAHVGVSLCEAEASVAAPMTSNQQTIASMITVVAEGRCTLMATYQIFQFIIGYALVQAFSTNLMYTYALNIGNYQYLVEDLFFTTISASLMGYTKPRSKLSSQRPFPRVLSWPLMMSTILQLLVVMVFQMAALAALHSQPGYVRTLGPPSIQQVVAAENTTIYIICLAQFIILAMVFNKGHPHRAPLRTNYGLVIALVGQVIFLLYTIFGSGAFNSNVQQLMPYDSIIDGRFRGVLLGLIIANVVVAVLAEFFCAGVMWTVRRSQKGIKYRQSRGESARLTSSSAQPAFL